MMQNIQKIKEQISRHISYRLAITISILMIAISSVTTVVMYQYLNGLLLEQNLIRSRQVLEQNALQIENLTHEIDTIGKNIITDGAIINYCNNRDDYASTYNATKAMTRLTSSLDIIHSSVLVVDNKSLWNLYPVDKTYDNLLKEDWYRNGHNGFSDVYDIQFGNKTLNLISYRKDIIETNNPNKKLATLLINIDLQRLDNWLWQTNSSGEDIALYMNNKLLSLDDTWPEYLNYEENFQEKYDNGYVLATLVGDGRFCVSSFITNDSLFANFNRILLLFVCTSLIVTIIFIYICVHMITQAMRPVDVLTRGIAQFAGGDLNTQVDIHSGDEFELLGDNFNHMVLNINQLLQESIEDEKIKKKLKFDMMISKIHPHFIYNTLNSVIVLARKQGNNDVIEMVKALILILQDGMSIHKDLLYDTIETEINVIKAYVTIQNYRYKDKIHLVIDIDDGLYSYRIAKNILQPIVENSIFHGIVPKSTDGTVTVSIHKKEDKLCIVISDDGVGIDEEMAARIEKGSNYMASNNDNSVHSIALVNVCERLEFLYGKNLRIKVNGEPGVGTTFMIDVPII